MKVAPGPNVALRRCVKSLGAAVLLLACLGGAPPASPQSQTTKLQGRVYYKGKSEPYPASYVRVTVTSEADKNSGRTTSTKAVYTGRDGWFYFTVPAGTYILEIWGSDSKKPLTSYRVRAAGPTTTIKMIVLP